MVFGWFGNKSERIKKSAEKHGNTLKNKVTTKEQRLEAMDALMAMDDHEIVIPQLMKRFQIVVDSGIQDKREKEMCLEHIVQIGAPALAFVDEALRSAERVAWPIKMAERLYQPEEFVTKLIQSLGREFVAFDDHVNNRNIEIILALKDHTSEAIVDAVSGFLQSRDESVRMAALECLEAQATQFEKARELIKDVLNLPAHDDNRRFLGVVRTMLEKNAW